MRGGASRDRRRARCLSGERRPCPALWRGGGRRRGGRVTARRSTNVWSVWLWTLDCGGTAKCTLPADHVTSSLVVVLRYRLSSSRHTLSHTDHGPSTPHDPKCVTPSQTTNFKHQGAAGNHSEQCIVLSIGRVYGRRERLELGTRHGIAYTRRVVGLLLFLFCRYI